MTGAWGVFLLGLVHILLHANPGFKTRFECKSRCTSTADAEIPHPHTPTHTSRGIDKDYDKDYDKEHSHTPMLPHPHTLSAYPRRRLADYLWHSSCEGRILKRKHPRGLPEGRIHKVRRGRKKSEMKSGLAGLSTCMRRVIVIELSS